MQTECTSKTGIERLLQRLERVGQSEHDRHQQEEDDGTTRNMMPADLSE
ncbi:MAG: hypothetical protein ACLR8P_04640 [Clostridium fessum]